MMHVCAGGDWQLKRIENILMDQNDQIGRRKMKRGRERKDWSMPAWGRILKQVYNIGSLQLTISPRRVLFIFCQFFLLNESETGS